MPELAQAARSLTELLRSFERRRGRKVESAGRPVGRRRRRWHHPHLVWDATTGREIHALKGHTTTVRSVHWSPDGRRLVSGSDDRTVRVWDSKTGRELLVWESNLKTVVGTTDYARLYLISMRFVGTVLLGL